MLDYLKKRLQRTLTLDLTPENWVSKALDDSGFVESLPGVACGLWGEGYGVRGRAREGAEGGRVKTKRETQTN